MAKITGSGSMYVPGRNVFLRFGKGSTIETDNPLDIAAAKISGFLVEGEEEPKHVAEVQDAEVPKPKTGRPKKAV